MGRVEDICQAMLLRELLSDPELTRALGRSDWLPRLAAALSGGQPAVDLGSLDARLGAALPEGVSRRDLLVLVPFDAVVKVTRGLSARLPLLTTAEDKYATACRTALCHAAAGSYYSAFGSLRVAAWVDDGWARHHQLYGLIHGACGRVEEARFELQLAREREPFEAMRGRIQEALAVLS